MGWNNSRHSRASGNPATLPVLDSRDDGKTLDSRLRGKWSRRWKIELIERTNPYWNDLFETLTA
jgi:predicted GIY-YIG superfamily endonuclease